MEHEFRQLPVKLTKAEILTKGKLAAKADIALGQLEDEKAEVTKDFADRIKSKRKELDALAREIRHGHGDSPGEVRPRGPVSRLHDGHHARGHARHRGVAAHERARCSRCCPRTASSPTWATSPTSPSH